MRGSAAGGECLALGCLRAGAVLLPAAVGAASCLSWLLNLTSINLHVLRAPGPAGRTGTSCQVSGSRTSPELGT